MKHSLPLAVLSSICAATLSPRAAAADEAVVLDRELMVGPRVGLALALWDSEVGDDVSAPLVGIGVDLRKELGRWVIGISGDLQIGTDSDAAGLTTDIGVDYYLNVANTSAYIGPRVGLRLGSGPVDYNANAFGVSFGGRLGVMFRRTYHTRWFVELNAGHAFMSYSEDSLGTPTPPDYGRTELAIMGGVLF